MSKVNLICLPYAGGNKYCYREYEAKNKHSLCLFSLEYPGRGSRIDQMLLTDTDLLVDDLFGQVKNIIENGNYAIYGHSFGGLLASLLTRKIVANNLKQPRHLFISGTPGPSASSRGENKKHLLGKADFIQEVIKLDGAPPDLLDNQELLDFIEPILRADFEASEMFSYKPQPMLDIPFTVFYGTEDDVLQDEVFLWQIETSLPVNFKCMTGNHFFIFKHAAEIMNIINDALINQ
jgi:surfactin synthase thioesterase subunit